MHEQGIAVQKTAPRFMFVDYQINVRPACREAAQIVRTNLLAYVMLELR